MNTTNRSYSFRANRLFEKWNEDKRRDSNGYGLQAQNECQRKCKEEKKMQTIDKVKEET